MVGNPIIHSETVLMRIRPCRTHGPGTSAGLTRNENISLAVNPYTTDVHVSRR
jgi:hypothetical protein